MLPLEGERSWHSLSPHPRHRWALLADAKDANHLSLQVTHIWHHQHTCPHRLTKTTPPELGAGDLISLGCWCCRREDLESCCSGQLVGARPEVSLQEIKKAKTVMRSEGKKKCEKSHLGKTLNPSTKPDSQCVVKHFCC